MTGTEGEGLTVELLMPQPDIRSVTANAHSGDGFRRSVSVNPNLTAKERGQPCPGISGLEVDSARTRLSALQSNPFVGRVQAIFLPALEP